MLENVYHCIEMVIGQGKDLAADGWTVSARASAEREALNHVP